MTEHILDARGFICPLPVLKARKKLLSMQAGDVLHVRVTDKNTPREFALFCTENNYILRGATESADGIDIAVEKT